MIISLIISRLIACKFYSNILIFSHCKINHINLTILFRYTVYARYIHCLRYITWKYLNFFGFSNSEPSPFWIENETGANARHTKWKWCSARSLPFSHFLSAHRKRCVCLDYYAFVPFSWISWCLALPHKSIFHIHPVWKRQSEKTPACLQEIICQFANLPNLRVQLRKVVHLANWLKTSSD